MTNALLHVTRINDFAVWLRGHGYQVETPKAGELLRIRKSPDVAPVIFHQREGSEHVSSIGDGVILARKFVREDQVANCKRLRGVR